MRHAQECRDSRKARRRRRVRGSVALHVCLLVALVGNHHDLASMHVLAVVDPIAFGHGVHTMVGVKVKPQTASSGRNPLAVMAEVAFVVSGRSAKRLATTVTRASDENGSPTPTATRAPPGARASRTVRGLAWPKPECGRRTLGGATARESAPKHSVEDREWHGRSPGSSHVSSEVAQIRYRNHPCRNAGRGCARTPPGFNDTVGQQASRSPTGDQALLRSACP